MAGFLSPRFNCRVNCPLDGTEQTVEFEASPKHGGDFLDVYFCSAVGEGRLLKCHKACRNARVTKEYCRETYVSALLYTNIG